MKKKIMYAIEKTLSDTFMEKTTHTYLYESKELRDEIFNNLLNVAKKSEYTEDLTFCEEEIKYYHSGDRVVEISKREIKICTRGNFNNSVFD